MSVSVLDNASSETMLAEVVTGLRKTQKELPCKYFYDERGSELFDQICQLPEYYPTIVELTILEEHNGEIAASIGPRATIIEFGSGSGIKTRRLLAGLENPAAYIPVDIAEEQLKRSAAAIRMEFSRLEVRPICADYTREFDLPYHDVRSSRRIVFFPGSTIGNFDPPEAVAFLERISEIAGSNGGLLIGVDLKKDPTILHAAYNDSSGVTARFNKNILTHLNRSLRTDFNPGNFQHYAYYDPEDGCIEMHLVSLCAQSVRINGSDIRLDTGESIRTERSYKYTTEEFRELADSAGLMLKRVWTDENEMFSVQHFETTSPL